MVTSQRQCSICSVYPYWRKKWRKKERENAFALLELEQLPIIWSCWSGNPFAVYSHFYWEKGENKRIGYRTVSFFFFRLFWSSGWYDCCCLETRREKRKKAYRSAITCPQIMTIVVQVCSHSRGESNWATHCSWRDSWVGNLLC